jgi:hypothetical protein
MSTDVRLFVDPGVLVILVILVVFVVVIVVVGHLLLPPLHMCATHSIARMQRRCLRQCPPQLKILFRRNAKPLLQRALERRRGRE